ncbi:MAG TPA: hypothetical protein ENG66_08450 [Thermococcus sp.]|nr:hypothetical protein [Thermococcus sp.]
MAKRSENKITQLYLADALKSEVDAWVNQGWPGITQTTYKLMHYWFDRDESAEERFYDCQRRAIETIIYCHEVLQATTLRDLFEKVIPEIIHESKPVKDEVEDIPFSKYCLKMATGSGKTWVLAALLIWQYFNALNKEKPHRAPGESKDWYSYRFLVVAPGREVLNRLMDSFKGKRDPKTGLRDPQTSDYKRSLFIPEDWKAKFNLEIIEHTISPNITPPEGPFLFVTNWQQFKLKKGGANLWEELTGEDIEEQPKGEIIADFLSEFPSLVIFNDEAHHVHGKKSKYNEELVWRRFMKVLYDRLNKKHKEDKGLFMQFDFSATPFFGSGKDKEYFPHIVYDYDLLAAMQDMLVKQIFLEERQSIAGERLEKLDFRALREEPEAGKRKGNIKGLSPGQKTLIDIGRTKLEQLTREFKNKGIEKKPVMMILCEETEVADLVKDHLADLKDDTGNFYDNKKVMVIHTELPDKELEEARTIKLDKIDDNSDPLNVVISVLMLREGFDRKNICVTVVLRATEADLLLEQIVGRGVRVMFPREEYPELWQAKKDAIEDIKRNRIPSSSFDFLFLVDHPRFRKFYENLRKEGYLIGEGETTRTSSTGDIIPVDAIPHRVEDYDIAWPVQIFEQGKMPDLKQIDVSKIPKYPTLSSFSSLSKSLGKLLIQETHMESGKKTKTWKLENKYFDYSYFLSQASKAIARDRERTILSGNLAEVAALVDEYTTNYLFGEKIDFSKPENYQVLNYTLIFDHVVNSIREAIKEIMGEIKYEKTGRWSRLSDIGRLMLRESRSVDATKCIYPKQGYAAFGGGFEKQFILDVLEPSIEVEAYAKLDKKHNLRIPYRDDNGILREYEIDFIIRTKDKIYLLETKGDRDISPRPNQNVIIKAKAANAWCENASTVKLPEGISQPTEWEYLILSDKLFKEYNLNSFDALVPICRTLRDKLLSF